MASKKDYFIIATFRRNRIDCAIDLGGRHVFNSEIESIIKEGINAHFKPSYDEPATVESIQIEKYTEFRQYRDRRMELESSRRCLIIDCPE